MRRSDIRGSVRAIAVAVLVCAISPAARADVVWQHTTLADGLSRAQREHRIVLLDFWASWCGPCETMDRSVWPRPEVGELVARSFIPLRIDADTPEGAALQQRFHVRSLPLVMTVRPDGTEGERVIGEVDAGLMREMLAAWSRGGTTLSVYDARAAAHPDDLELRLNVGTRYAEIADAPHAVPHLQAVIAGDHDDARGLASLALYSLGFRLYYRALHDDAHAIEPLARLARQFPESESGERAFVPLAAARHRTGHDAEALAGLDGWIEHSPSRVRTTHAQSAAEMMLREHWDLAHAERIARAGLANDPQHAPCLDTLAEIVFTLGRAAEAARLERDAVRVEPANARYQSQLARFTAAAPASTRP